MSDIKNKVAFISGGSKGIGFGVAKVLMLEGMKVVITSRSQESANKAATELNELGSGEAFGVASDVKSLDSQQQAVAQAIDKYGKIDLLLANAGVGHFASIEDLTEEQYDLRYIKLPTSTPMCSRIAIWKSSKNLGNTSSTT